MTTPTTLKEAIKYLEDNGFDVDEIRITAKFGRIDDDIDQWVNSVDKQWVACDEKSQPHEVKSAISAIKKIISPAKPTNPTVEEAVKTICEEFKNISKKPRIPFYVAVLNKLSY